VHELHHEDHPEHQQGRGGVDEKEHGVARWNVQR
jgi:hypothetical protein